MKLHVLSIATSCLVLCSQQVLGFDSRSLYELTIPEPDQKQMPKCFSESFPILGVVIDYFFEPIPDDLKDWCKFTKGDVAKCNIKKALNESSYALYESKCQEVGGEIFKSNVIDCPPVGEEKASKFIIPDVPMCASTNCTLPEVKELIKMTILYPGGCAKQKGTVKFALKVNKETKKFKKMTCRELARKPKKTRENICLSKKYQTYGKKILPASRSCPRTCKTFPPVVCVEETPRAKFKVYTPEGAKMVKTCGWLGTQTNTTIGNTCREGRDDDKKKTVGLGYAYEVCTKTC